MRYLVIPVLNNNCGGNSVTPHAKLTAADSDVLAVALLTSNHGSLLGIGRVSSERPVVSNHGKNGNGKLGNGKNGNR